MAELNVNVNVPVTSATTPFWDAAREGRLVLPRCQRCGRAHWYPRHTCPFCASRDLTWVPAEGSGTLETFTVVRQAFATAGARREPPYVVGIVRLAEGPRMTSSLVDCPLDELRVGLPVRVRFDEVSGLDVPIPVFAPA
jgi:uncharacterized OB-fold protein